MVMMKVNQLSIFQRGIRYFSSLTGDIIGSEVNKNSPDYLVSIKIN